jgi:hypothetical protein
MGEYDYEKPTQPIPRKQYDMRALLSSMTDMEDEEAPFVGGIYGPAGSGKTFTTMELAQRITPPDKKIIYIFTNQGWTSLKNEPQLMHRVKKMPYSDFDQIRAFCEALRNPQFREMTKIGTVVFDEFNTMFDMNIEAITNLRSTQATGKYKDPDTPEWPEYNTAKMHMINLMNDVLATPGVNFLFVAHPRFQKKTGFTEPDFFEKASQAFMRVLHSLYYLHATEVDGKVVRRIQLMGSDQVVAKNRIGGLGMYADNVKQVSDAFKKWSASKEIVATETTVVNNLPPQLISGEVVDPVDIVPSVEEAADGTETPEAPLENPADGYDVAESNAVSVESEINAQSEAKGLDDIFANMLD